MLLIFCVLKKKKYILLIFQNIVWVVFIPLKQKTNLNCIKKVHENKDFCNVFMPSQDTKILGFNQYKIFDKTPFIIYADLECIIKKIGGCKYNPENSSTAKVSILILSVFSMPTISPFKVTIMHIEVKMKMFCKY